MPEMIPIEPDPDNAGEGKRKEQPYPDRFGISCLFQPLALLRASGFFYWEKHNGHFHQW